MSGTHPNFVKNTVTIEIPPGVTEDWFAGITFDAKGNVVKVEKVMDRNGMRVLAPANTVPPSVAHDPEHNVCPSGPQCHRVIGTTHICVC